jgi:hypothetical protein
MRIYIYKGKVGPIMNKKYLTAHTLFDLSINENENCNTG